jgi:ribosomal protein S7
MPKVTMRIGAREQLNPTISKATLLLPTEALVWIGATSIAGTATAMRALANALTKAAELADAYDADPDAFNQREQADRTANP